MYIDHDLYNVKPNLTSEGGRGGELAEAPKFAEHCPKPENPRLTTSLNLTKLTIYDVIRGRAIALESFRHFDCS
jgi:hypothetical protein